MSPSRAWTSSCTAKDSSPSSSLILGALLAALLAPCQLSLRLRDLPNRRLSSTSELSTTILSSMPSTELLSPHVNWSPSNIKSNTRRSSARATASQATAVIYQDMSLDLNNLHMPPLSNIISVHQRAQSPAVPYNTTITRSSSKYGGCSSATYSNASSSSTFTTTLIMLSYHP